ncbi:MAG: hypothetical protein HDQ88_06865 [Clostridia bacterium]|nr:hypothetical protein [Clostridia bacterium]
MAISQNSKINTQDLVNRFKEVVVSRILDGVVDSTSCPMVDSANGKVPAIPPDILDSKKNISGELVLGNNGQTTINAAQLLTEVLRITKDLTRVGTYVVILKKKRTRSGVNAQGHDYSEPDSMIDAGTGTSGEALFTPSYIRQNFEGGSTAGILAGNTIKASDLTNLFANMYNAWASASRYQHQEVVNICHDTCHSPCHSTCHTHCHSTCHGWGGNGALNKTCHSINGVDCALGNTFNSPGAWTAGGIQFPGYPVEDSQLFNPDLFRYMANWVGPNPNSHPNYRFFTKPGNGTCVINFKGTNYRRGEGNTNYAGSTDGCEGLYDKFIRWEGSILYPNGDILVSNGYTVKANGEVIAPG